MNKTHWLVQDVGIIGTNIQANFSALERLNFKFSNFGLINSTKDITNLENILHDPEELFIIRGGTKMLTILNNVQSLSEINSFLTPEQLTFNKEYTQKLKDGIFYNELNFDQAYYSTLELPLLNKDSTMYKIVDNLDRKFDNDFFVKPSKDQKAFNGGILKAGTTIKEFIFSQRYQMSYLTESLLVSSIKEIQGEYRFFVVNNEVITGSQYSYNKKPIMNELIPPHILKTAKKYALLYQPHEIFTMDLCETDKGISIVEYNCWNASGLYKSDILTLFNVINEHMQYKKPNKNHQIK